MIPFSCRHFYVNSTSFNGILKLIICREYHYFCVKIELYEIIYDNNPDLLASFIETCNQDSTNDRICSLITTNLKETDVLLLNQIESFLTSIEKINNVEINTTDYYLISVGNIKISTTTDVIKKLYLFFDGFVRSYHVLDASYNMSIYLNDLKKESEPKVIEKVIEQPVELPKNIVQESTDTELDLILSMCGSENIKSSLIHYIFNYYRFIDPKYCYAEQINDNIVIHSPCLFPSGMVFNQEYFESLLYTNSKDLLLPFDKIEYYLKKLTSLFISMSPKIISNSIYIMAINYLIFVYFMRYFYDMYPEKIKEGVMPYLVRGDLQSKIFNHFLKTLHYLEDHINFNISDFNQEQLTNNLDTINKLSDEYSHMIKVSSEKFTDLIMESISRDNKKPINFNLNKMKILDLSNLINKEKKELKSLLFSTNNLESSNINDYFQFFGENLTKEYDNFLKYCQNPSNLLVINEDVEIKNSFEIINRNILSNLTNKDINLLHMYNLIVESLPHPELLQHSTILRILYRILVPYQYKTHNLSKFEDYFA